jgi:hypothetical protein
LDSLVARKKPSANSVFVLNLFLGWTLIGWVGALALALWKTQEQATPMAENLASPSCEIASKEDADPEPAPEVIPGKRDDSGRWVID